LNQKHGIKKMSSLQFEFVLFVHPQINEKAEEKREQQDTKLTELANVILFNPMPEKIDNDSHDFCLLLRAPPHQKTQKENNMSQYKINVETFHASNYFVPV